jgi:hypothetical protein
MPEKDAGYQSGDRLKPFSPFTPDFAESNVAIHAWPFPYATIVSDFSGPGKAVYECR